MHRSILPSLLLGLGLSASAGAAVTLVHADSAVTATNSGPGDFTLTNDDFGTRDGLYEYGYNAGAPIDGLIVTVSREASAAAQNENGAVFSVTYGGTEMILATGATSGSGVSIFYLETTSVAGILSLNFNGFATVNGIGLGIASVSSTTGNLYLSDAASSTGSSISVDTLYADSFAIFGGDSNATTGSASIDSPLTTIYTQVDVGSNQAGAGYQEVATAGTQNYSWSPNSDPRGIAAASFASIPEPHAAALIGLGGMVLLVRRRK